MSIAGLQGGPRQGWVYTDADFQIRIEACQHIGRTNPTNDPVAWALGYRLVQGKWTWIDGTNQHPYTPAPFSRHAPESPYMCVDVRPMAPHNCRPSRARGPLCSARLGLGR